MKNKESIKTMICFGLVLFSQILFLAGSQKMSRIEDRVWLTRSNSENPITAEMLHRLQSENEKIDKPIAFAAWNEKKNEEVLVQELNKSASATAVAVTERADILFPGCRTFDKAYTNTCIISEELACELFGSADVKKLHVRYGGQKYEIQDIIKDNTKLFLYYRSSVPDDTYTEITAAGGQDKSQKMIKAQLEERLGVSLRYVDYSFPHFIYEILFLIYFLFVCGYLCRRLYKRKEADIKVMLIAVLVIAGVIICTQLPGIPKDAVPTHFSDRGFWVKLADEQRDNFQFIFSKEKFCPEKVWFQGQLLALLGLAASALGWVKLRKRKFPTA